VISFVKIKAVLCLYSRPATLKYPLQGAVTTPGASFLVYSPELTSEGFIIISSVTDVLPLKLMIISLVALLQAASISSFALII
jgi:hypothetical protein